MSCDTFWISVASASRLTGSRAAHALEHLARPAMPSSIDSASSLRRGRETERDVLQHFDQHAAEAEGDQLAERRDR